MSDWLEHDVLPAAIVAALLLLVLWPTEHSGRRLLQTWGIPEPRPEQTRAALRYLWQRRILYIVLFLVVPPVAGALIENDDELPGMGIFVPLLVAMLLAETVATLRPVGGVRVASLDRRTWRALVPRWAVHTMAVMVVLSVGLAVLALTVGPVHDNGLPEPGPGTALAYLAVCLAMIGLLVHLAVRRPSVADAEVDAALRTRTARVAFGIGFGWVGGTLLITSQWLYGLYSISRDDGGPARPAWLTDWFGRVMEYTGLVQFVVVIVCWMWVALPTRRSLAVTTR